MASGNEEKYGQVAKLFSPKVRKQTLYIPRFDTTNDNFSDHVFANIEQSFTDGDATHKAISKEWKILGNSLPDSIYVQVSEQRIDLMRAAIIGPQGTPYHDGLFIFDIFFPTDYPNVPPNVRYRSFGLRLNPNIYENGSVCLSLLNTWSGRENERWIPKKSTVLQVLVSIQALVLNEKPYFNEPGWAIYGAEKLSRNYNEKVFALSCKSMVFLLRKPPKSFQQLVVSHFYDRAQVILTACQAYINGFQRVGYYQKDQPFLEEREKVCGYFRISMEKPYENLVVAFGKINPNPTNERFFVKLNKMVVETGEMHKLKEELKILEAEKNMHFLLKKLRAWFRVLKDLVFS